MAGNEAGKGSKPRKGRDDKAYSSGWDRIFGSKEEKEQCEELKNETECTSSTTVKP